MHAEYSLKPQSVLRIESVILLVLTVTVYAAFLTREMGYVDYFGIPHELIATSQIGLVSAAKALMWGALAYVGKVNLVWIFAPQADGYLYSTLRYAIGAGLILCFAAYPYVSTDISWWWFWGVYAFCLFGLFVWPLITQKRVEGYENKMVAQMRLETEQEDLYGVLFHGLDRSTRITLIFIVAIMLFAYGDGRRSAIEQEVFNQLDGEPGAVLLRIYGDVFVSANVDVKSRQLSGLIKIQKIEGGKWLAIRRTKLGQLKKAPTT